MKRKLVAALACRNQGTRLYGKPIQNLDIENGITILDNVISCLQSITCVDEVVLGISEGIENEVFIKRKFGNLSNCWSFYSNYKLIIGFLY